MVSLAQAKDISPEEEQNLMNFLVKVSRACDNDPSVDGFIGEQVNEWIKELKDKQPDQK